jgi:hypothetical protein
MVVQIYQRVIMKFKLRKKEKEIEEFPIMLIHKFKGWDGIERYIQLIHMQKIGEPLPKEPIEFNT